MGGATTTPFDASNSFAGISIHAPRGGSDLQQYLGMAVQVPFQSTLPVGGATTLSWIAPRAIWNFNPRSPWGERPPTMAAKAVTLIFQSTLPVGGATLNLLQA